MVERRLLAWQACLRLRRRRMSPEEQIGLSRELEILRLVAAETGFNHAIDAWQGPLDGLHDFIRSGAAIEVKAVLGVGSHLRISHYGQLEYTGLSILLIARPRFREDHAGRSLAATERALGEFRRNARDVRVVAAKMADEAS